MHSTSGAYLVLVGPHTWYPLAASSDKQTVVSHSTTEAEVIAAERAMRESGVPALDLWETILGRPVRLTLLEDNQTTAMNIRSGKFPKLRHIQRMHGVNVRWLYEALVRKVFYMEDCHTQRMAADIFTKHFTSADSWNHAIKLLGFMSKSTTNQFCTSSTSSITPCCPDTRGMNDVDDPGGSPQTGDFTDMSLMD